LPGTFKRQPEKGCLFCVSDNYMGILISYL
jgi:hypothetical protein